MRMMDERDGFEDLIYNSCVRSPLFLLSYILVAEVDSECGEANEPQWDRLEGRARILTRANRDTSLGCIWVLFIATGSALTETCSH
jgi:hypothetical protein